VSEHALSGVRILALEQAVSGPFASHILADMGAEVIKIERPGRGDVIRTWDGVVHGLSTGYVWLNRRKRSVTVDATTAEGRGILRRLALQSDVFLTNFAVGVADRLGLDYASLHRDEPRLIYCAISGYGLDGPASHIKAYDLLIQGETGILATTGSVDAPAKVSIPVCDLSAGMYAALGIVLALHQRERCGEGQLVDISMFESMLEWLGYFPHHLWHAGEEPPRSGMRHPYIVPYGPYLASDGEYVNLAVSSPQDWETFCASVIERPDLVTDERFVDAPARRRNRGMLEPLLERVMASRDSMAWLERLSAAKLPNGRVRGIAEVLQHPQVEARHLIRTVSSPVGPLPTIESALRMSASPVAPGGLPELGGDTDAVLSDAGYTAGEVSSFRRAGVV
jgi:itaconate CoA-transferase